MSLILDIPANLLGLILSNLTIPEIFKLKCLSKNFISTLEVRDLWKTILTSWKETA